MKLPEAKLYRKPKMKTRKKQTAGSYTKKLQRKKLMFRPKVFSSTWCSAPKCTNSRAKYPTLSFFRFPRLQHRWKQWVVNSRRYDLLDKGADYAQRNCHLCAKHFEDSQFMNAQEKRRLVHDALPTLFDVPNPPARIVPKERKPFATKKTYVVPPPPLLPELRMKIDHSYATADETAANDVNLLKEVNTSAIDEGIKLKNLSRVSMSTSTKMPVEINFDFESDVKSDEMIESSLSCSSLDDDVAEWSALLPRQRPFGSSAVLMDDGFDKDNITVCSAIEKSELGDYCEPTPEAIAYSLENSNVDGNTSAAGSSRTLFRVPLEELPSFMAQQKIAGLYRSSGEEVKQQKSEAGVMKLKREVRSLKTQVTRQKRRIWELEAEVDRLEETAAIRPQGIMQELDELGMSTFATSFIKSQVRRAMTKNMPSAPWSRADMEVATTLYQQSVPVYRVWQRFFTMPKMKTVVAYLEKCKEVPTAASTSSL